MEKTKNTVETAIFAAGCFWGVEYMMRRAVGVLDARVGYIGGDTEAPCYQEVCAGNTGHFEALEVTFDNTITSFEALAKLFFEIHDFTQADGQGPDIGAQYLSRIFYLTPAQKETAQKLVKVLEGKGYNVATQILPAERFWPAEPYHQNYYAKKGTAPYCHTYKKIF